MFEAEVSNIYPLELMLKKITERETILSYLDIEISTSSGRYSTKLYDNLTPYMCSNILAKPTYGLYISQLIRISRICDDFCHKTSFIRTSRFIKEEFVSVHMYSRACLLRLVMTLLKM